MWLSFLMTLAVAFNLSFLARVPLRAASFTGVAWSSCVVTRSGNAGRLKRHENIGNILQNFLRKTTLLAGHDVFTF